MILAALYASCSYFKLQPTFFSTLLPLYGTPAQGNYIPAIYPRYVHVGSSLMPIKCGL